MTGLLKMCTVSWQWRWRWRMADADHDDDQYQTLWFHPRMPDFQWVALTNGPSVVHQQCPQGTCYIKSIITTQWNFIQCTTVILSCSRQNFERMRHNIRMTSHERHVASNHRSFDCLFNSLWDPHQTDFKVCVTGPLWGEFTGDQWIFRKKRASNT